MASIATTIAMLTVAPVCYSSECVNYYLLPLMLQMLRSREPTLLWGSVGIAWCVRGYSLRMCLENSATAKINPSTAGAETPKTNAPTAESLPAQD